MLLVLCEGMHACMHISFLFKYIYLIDSYKCHNYVYYAYMHIYIYINMYTNVYIYTQIYIHTHNIHNMYTHIQGMQISQLIGYPAGLRMYYNAPGVLENSAHLFTSLVQVWSTMYAQAAL